MYENFYGLIARPFQLTPDPDFYFDSRTHRKALSYLGYGLAQGEGFIVITGEIGSGKSTLVAHLMRTIDRARLNVAQIVTSQLGARDLLRMIARQFGVAADDGDKAQLLTALEAHFHEQARLGRRSLLIVDEAQMLGREALEELRMLSNLQLGNQAVLQIFLLGQPEFRDMLHGDAALEQLRQRVIATHHLEGMTADEIKPYIEHRLNRAGWSGRPSFSTDAITEIYNYSHGIPRLLNAFMSRVLLMGSVEQADHIDGVLVRAVHADIVSDVPVGTMDEAPQNTDQPAATEADAPEAVKVESLEADDETVENDDAFDEAEVTAVEPLDSEEDVAITANAASLAVIANAMTAGNEDAASPVDEVEQEAGSDPSEEIATVDASVEPEAVTEETLSEETLSSEQLGELTERIAVLESSLSMPQPLEQDVAATADRVGALEARMAEQERALRRIVTKLIDWVEAEEEKLHRAA